MKFDRVDHTVTIQFRKGIRIVVSSEKDNVIRGKFRNGENSFMSSSEKTEKIMKDVDRIRKKTEERRAKLKEERSKE